MIDPAGWLAGGDDTSCNDLGFLYGERGTWQVFDATCRPRWGNFKDDGCKSKGFRQYSSVLYDIPNEQSWEDWCRHFPADIKGVGTNTQHFFQPDRWVSRCLSGRHQQQAGVCYAAIAPKLTVVVDVLGF